MDRILLLSLLCVSNLFSQSYQLIRYDIKTNKIDTLPMIDFNNYKTSEFTNWNYGIDNNFELLSLEPPQNSFNNSGFTDFLPAQKFFDINKFPVRTAVKIYWMENDTLRQRCSGILIAKNYVLTDCHCIGITDSLSNFVFEDSSYIYPAFDNGILNPLWNTTEAIEYITFKENLHDSYPPLIDIALIKLKDSIGLMNGWIGLGFNEDNSFFENNVFHKFSYPGTVDYSNSTRIFNGDTLYYNYGKLGLVQSNWIGYNITGIPGQSGSSLFYTNNSNEYYSLGTLVWSGFSRHRRINKEIFYSFKSILESDVSSIATESDNRNQYFLANAFPNPFNPSTVIKYSMKNSGFVELIVFNLLGQEIVKLINEEQQAGDHQVEFNAIGLASGIYFYRLQTENFVETKKMLLIR